ncbi:MAG TPA: hypothetical protein VGD65_07790 [Chryseosolibacter sp.]
MKPRYEIKVFNASLVFILYLLIGMYSCTQAQAIQRICQKGYEVSYGLHNFKPRVAGEPSTKLSPGARGITLGGFVGNNLLKMRLRGLGYYEANRVFDENFYQYEAEILSNLSPLEFFRVSKNVIDIYLITGLNYTQINFDNHYSAYAKKRFDRISRVAGIGAEYIIRKGNKSICVFSEATVANRFRDLKGEEEKTPFPSVQSALNFGLRIGYTRHVKIKPGF